MGIAKTVLSDFKITSKLGSGCYGAVYRVLRVLDGQHYAMKEMDLLGMSKKEAEDCVREASVLSQLEHDHIIRYYDSFIEKGKLYIITELAEGGNLFDFLKQHPGRLKEELVWKLFIQMALALNYMHKMKILHRDVKSLNVMLSSTDADTMMAKVGDLGVARFLSTKTDFARTLVGTPYYLSPELCEDRPYNERSDVWALGVVLYECCTQRHPFDADNQGALILKILRGKFPPVTGYSKELVGLVNRCLVLDMNRRPDTDRILSLPSLRKMAHQLQIPLPPAVYPERVPVAPKSMVPRAAAGVRFSGLTGGLGPQLDSKEALKSSSRASQPLVPSGVQESAKLHGRPTSLQEVSPRQGGPAVKKQSLDDMPLQFSAQIVLQDAPAIPRKRGNSAEASPEPAAHVSRRPPPKADPSRPRSKSLEPESTRERQPNTRHDTPRKQEATHHGYDHQGFGDTREDHEVMPTEEGNDNLFEDIDQLRAHSVLMDESATTIKQQCVAKIGKQAFDNLYHALRQQADDDSDSNEELAVLGKAALKALQCEQRDVIPLMYKLLYVENQRDTDLARVGSVTMA